MRTTYITIKRPNGEIERTDVSEKFNGLTDVLFEKVKEATAAASKGECLSYENVDNLSEKNKKEIQEETKKIEWFKKHGFSEKDVN